jgi:uncharacterized repeat protein (TIGR03803 family)
LAGGNLWGVTQEGGAHQEGTVFEVARPPAGSSTWTESVIYSFGSSSDTDGAFPTATNLTFDRQGNIWGVTKFGGGNASAYCSFGGCGTVYKLAPSSGTWTETIVHAFPASDTDGVEPVGGLILSLNGALFGTTSANYGEAGGIVFGVSRF